MEAPYDLTDVEDSMPSRTFRTFVAVAALTTIPVLHAATAQAGTRREPAAAQAEKSPVESLWQWLTEILSPSGGLERIFGSSTFDTWSPNRGGVYDPNGQS
jgi:hypothetical protein